MLGTRILAEQWSNGVTIIYAYDSMGSPVGMLYRTANYAADVFDTYLFQKNLQGDVIAVYNKSGTKLVGYVYDAWGNVTTTYYNGGTSTGAQYNPFTYRGYYRDAETGFYYLNSRYYDPVIGRFLNPDGIGVTLATPFSLTDKNLYAYCDNNPVTRADDGGEFWHIIAGAVVGAAVNIVMNVAEQLKSGDDFSWGELVIAAVSGATSGALTSCGVSPVVNMLGQGVIAGAESIFTQALEKGFDKISLAEVAFDASFAALTSFGGNKDYNRIHNHLTTQKSVYKTRKHLKPLEKGAAKKYYKSQTNKLKKILACKIIKRSPITLLTTARDKFVSNGIKDVIY